MTGPVLLVLALLAVIFVVASVAGVRAAFRAADERRYVREARANLALAGVRDAA